jgi:hypothetical protein
MRANSRLILIGVVKTFDIVKIGDIKGSDVVGGCESKVDKFTILGDVGAGGRLVSASCWTGGGRGSTY